MAYVTTVAPGKKRKSPGNSNYLCLSFFPYSVYESIYFIGGVAGGGGLLLILIFFLLLIICKHLKLSYM